MKKFLFIILVLIFVLNINVLFSQDNTNDVSYNRAIEFSVGGGLIHSLVIFNEFHNGTLEWHNFSGHSILPIVPFSFIYYPISKFGIGFNYTIGVELLIPGFIDFSGIIIIDNKLKIVNKIGSIKKKKWLLIEYGMIFAIWMNTYGMFFGVPPHFEYGPDFFIGFEKAKNKFAFTAGGIFYFLYADVPPVLTTDYYDAGNYKTARLYFGVEFRWRFAYFKPLK